MLLSYYLFGAIFLWLVLISIFLFKTLSHYKNLTKDVSKKDLLSSLNHLIAKAEENASDISKVSDLLASVIEKDKKHLQKIGFLRYNPFVDTGGDQSFSLCLLDENGDGIVISSLHSRENTRLYSKMIHGSKAENQVFSKEEQEVIKLASK